MDRREFIKKSALGLTAVALGSVGVPPMFKRIEAVAANVGLNLDIIEVYHEMIDGTKVYSWAYATGAGPTIPGPVIWANEGDTINLSVTNRLDEPHGFAIPGLVGGTFLVDSGPILPKQTGKLSFPAPPPGTYIYFDSQNDPVGRVLGLHGVLVVQPNPVLYVAPNKVTPYSATNVTPNVQLMFNHLGTAAFFRGVPWNPLDPMQTKIWVFSEVDPVLNTAVMNLAPGAIFDRFTFAQNFLPRYFLINGRSGYFSANSDEISLHGPMGRPILIRNVHVGLDTHSPHIHANHGWIISVDNVIGQGDPLAPTTPEGSFDNLWWVDTWSMLPMNRVDVLYPMIMPPDIPRETWARCKLGAWHPTRNPDGTQEMMALFNLTDPPTALNSAHPCGAPGQITGLAYPMHSHQEISQGANGGNYPSGLITHIEFHGWEPGYEPWS